jgi:hypothetical protein
VRSRVVRMGSESGMQQVRLARENEIAVARAKSVVDELTLVVSSCKRSIVA